MEERPHREKKIAELLHREVGRIIADKVLLPEGVLITVSRVVPSANHQHAAVFVTVFPFEKSEEAFEKIQKHVREVQHTLNSELNMRPVPKIRFVLDESEEKARRLLDVLNDETSTKPD